MKISLRLTQRLIIMYIMYFMQLVHILAIWGFTFFGIQKKTIGIVHYILAG